jgi:hypothetical protein
MHVELYIDQWGVIRKVSVWRKDPVYGFAKAAVKALEGVMTSKLTITIFRLLLNR